MTISLRPLIWITAFLLSFQFIGNALSIFETSFEILLASSVIIAILVATGISFVSRQSIQMSVKQALVLGAAIASTMTLFILRLNWHMFDLICPTGILGAVGQISNGSFPATFLAFPEVTMNYHQGFLFLSGTFAFLGSISPATAIYVTYILLFFLILCMIAGYFMSINNKYFFVPLVLLILVSSVSTRPFLDLGWASDVNVAEYLTSNSWPLALLAVLFILFLLKRFTESRWIQASTLFIILCVSTANATVFGVVVLTGAILFAIHVYRIGPSFFRKNFSSIIACFSVIIALFLIPRYIPSAYLLGDNYESPVYAIRLFEYGIPKYVLNMARYAWLSSILTWFVIAYAAVSCRRRDIPLDRRAVFAGLLISFIFPSIVLFKEVNAWDNIHKFALFNIFLSSIAITYCLSETGRIFNKKYAVIAVTAAITGSAFANMNILFNRTSTDFNRFSSPNSSIANIVALLKSNNSKGTLIPYRIDDAGRCNEDGFSAIAQYAGWNLKYSYFDSFLLSKELEAENAEGATWQDKPETFKQEICSLSANDMIIVRTEDKEEFERKLFEARSCAPNRIARTYDGYLLY